MEMSTTTTGTLTVTGEGQVRATPDRATLSLGVLTQGKAAQRTVEENAEIASRVIAAIKALGIPSEDIRTVGLNISPIQDYDEKSPTYGQIIGYRVEDRVSVEAPVGMAGKVLDTGVSAGANVGGNLSFGITDEGTFRQQALQAAVQAARRDAEVVANAMGVTIVGARTAEVLHGGAPTFVRGAMMEKAMATPIEPGSLTLSASVRVVFDYRDGAPSNQA